MNHFDDMGVSDDYVDDLDGKDILTKKERPCFVDPVTKCAILGVSQVMAQIEDAAVLIHGPKGCAFPAYEATIYDPLVFNFSEMCENNVVFGGENLIKEKIYDTYFDNIPSILSVVTTCSTEIIGDDVQGIIDSVDVPIPVVRMEGVGFKRDNWESTDHAIIELVKHFSKGVKKSELVRDGSINLFCHVGTSVRWKEEVKLIEETLRLMGRKVRRVICNNKVTDLPEIVIAEINVVLSPQVGVEAAEFIKRRYGTPYVVPGFPVGLEQTINFVKQVADALGIDVSERLEEEAHSIRRRFRAGLGRVSTFRPFDKLKKLKTVVVGEPSIAIAYMNFLKKELEVVPSIVVLKSQGYHELDIHKLRAENLGTEIIEISDNMLLKELFAIEKPELLFANDLEFMLSKPISDPVYINICYPGARKVKMLDRPYIGFEGALYLGEDILNGVIARYEAIETFS